MKLHGDYREDRHGARIDAELANGIPDKPAGLDEGASYVWDLVTGNLPEGQQSKIDAPLLIMLCRWWSIWRKFDAMLEAGEGDPYKVLIQATAASKQVCTLAGRFGLSPVDRTKLLRIEPEKEADEFEAYQEIG